MDEMNANPVDLGPVLREAVDASLKAAPVIFIAPVRNERLGLLEGDVLRPVADGFALRPPRGRGILDNSRKAMGWLNRSSDGRILALSRRSSLAKCFRASIFQCT